MVTMTHPDLPGREIQVASRAVSARERRGWVEASSPSVDAAVEYTSLEGDATPSKGDDEE